MMDLEQLHKAVGLF